MGNKLITYYQKSSLRTKINISIVGSTGIILIVLLAIVSIRSRSIVLKYAEKATISLGKEFSSRAVEYMNNKESALQMMASSFTSQYDLLDLKFDIYQNTIKQFAKDEPDVFAIWYQEDFKEGESTVDKSYIYSASSSAEAGPILEKLKAEPEVKNLKDKEDVWISEPVSIDGKWYFHMVVAYKHEGRHVGVVGFVIKNDYLQEIVANAMPHEDGFCKIISHNGSVVAYPDLKRIGSKTDDGEYTDSVITKVKNSEHYYKYIWSNTYGSMSFKMFEPIKFQGTNMAWSFCTIVPTYKVLSETHTLLIATIILAILGLAAVVWLTSILSKKISSPVVETSEQLTLIADGRLDKASVIENPYNDEIGQMITSVNTLIESQKELAHFANEIGMGNLEVKIEAKNSEDLIGNAMVEMKQSLIDARKADEQRRHEDEVSTWKVNGNSRIHEEIRKENLSIKQLCTSVLREIVTYSKSIQGGIFVIDDSDTNEPVVDLVACIAYNREKMLQKQISIQEGLVGRCIYEKAPILLNEIPQDYLSITSGLGEENPGFLALIPLISNDIIVGVLEIASFKVLDKNDLEYLTKAGESLASAVSNVRINERTQRLLAQSKQFAEEIGAQEEELRQNMEEMQAAQEEMFRKTKEYEDTISELQEKLNQKS